MKCDACGGPTTPTLAWYQVVGYEQPRTQGGTNALALRKRTGKVICDGCIRRRKAGIADGQQTL